MVNLPEENKKDPFRAYKSNFNNIIWGGNNDLIFLSSRLEIDGSTSK